MTHLYSQVAELEASFARGWKRFLKKGARKRKGM